MGVFCDHANLQVDQVAFFYCENRSPPGRELIQRVGGTHTPEDVNFIFK